MRLVILITALTIVILPGDLAGQSTEKHSFAVSVKEGDTFTDDVVWNSRTSMKVGDRVLIRQVTMTTRENFTTIERIDPKGQVLQVLEETKKEDIAQEVESRGQTKSTTNTGPFHGVAIRSTWKDGNYERSLVAGENNPRVTKRLAEKKETVLNNELLPHKPIAIGETFTADADRTRALLNSLGEGAMFTKPLTVTLKEIKMIDNVSTAIFDGAAQIKSMVPLSQGAAPVLVDLQLAYHFNFDQQFVSHLTMRIDGSSEFEQGGMKLLFELSGDMNIQATKRPAN